MNCITLGQLWETSTLRHSASILERGDLYIRNRLDSDDHPSPLVKYTSRMNSFLSIKNIPVLRLYPALDPTDGAYKPAIVAEIDLPPAMIQSIDDLLHDV